MLGFKYAHHFAQSTPSFCSTISRQQNSFRCLVSDYQKNRFTSFNELHTLFARADLVGRLVVFNIGGNKYRLIAAIHFNRQKVYIRHILTHAEYDRGSWK